MSNKEIAIFKNQTEAMATFSTANLARNPELMSGVSQIAAMMSTAKGMVPDQILNKQGTCFGIAIKASVWGMDAFSLAQHSFEHRGVIGYEGKIYQSVMESFGGVKFSVEYFGDWSGYIRSGARPKRDQVLQIENDLGILIKGKFPDGETKELRVTLAQCMPRLSTNWQCDPEQQIWYAGMKKYARRYCNSMMLGVMDYEDIASREKDISPTIEKTNESEKVISNGLRSKKAKTEKKADPEPEKNPEPQNEATQENSNDNGSTADNTGFEEFTPYDEVLGLINSISDAQSAKEAGQAYKKHKDSFSRDERGAIFPKLKASLKQYGLI